MIAHDISRYQDLIVTTSTNVGLKILAAIGLWAIGPWLIGRELGMVRFSLERQKIAPTTLCHLASMITVALNVLLVIGIQTMTFAADEGR